jgi:DNA-directed RNA polymerase subunit RPC12/RpoP
MIRFACNSCGKVYISSDDQSGTKVTCRQCGSQMTITAPVANPFLPETAPGTAPDRDFPPPPPKRGRDEPEREPIGERRSRRSTDDEDDDADVSPVYRDRRDSRDRGEDGRPDRRRRRDDDDDDQPRRRQRQRDDDDRGPRDRGGYRCPFCDHIGIPLHRQKVSGAGWILFVVLLFVCFPLCWLPFVVDGCKVRTRICVHCGEQVG